MSVLFFLEMEMGLAQRDHLGAVGLQDPRLHAATEVDVHLPAAAAGDSEGF